MADLLELEMEIATAREVIAELLTDMPEMDDSEKLNAEGELADWKRIKSELENARKFFMYHNEAIWTIRKAILAFEIKQTSHVFVDFNPDKSEMLEYMSESKFAVDRVIRAVISLGGERDAPFESGAGDFSMCVSLPKEALKEIRSLKKPRNKRKK